MYPAFVVMLTFVSSALSVFAPLGVEPQTGRYADLKAQSFTAFDRGRYAEVAGKLESVWEEDQSDPKVAEYLAMGYLYGDRSIAKAKPLMEKAIALGGQASFLVIHSHERIKMLHGNIISEFCSGKLSVTPGKLLFVSESGEHTATITASSLKDFTISKGPLGVISIKTKEKSYTFRVKTHSRSEAVLLGHLAEQNLKR